MRKFTKPICVLAVVAAFALAGPASAALTGIKDTSALAKQYSASDVLGGTDGWNGTGLLGGAASDANSEDFFENGDGNLQYTTRVASGGTWVQQDAAGSYFVDNVGADSSYTLEVSIKMEQPASGTHKAYIWAENAGSQGTIYEIWNAGSNLGGDPGNDNTDAFHVFRVAFDADDDLFYYWRDGVLLDNANPSNPGGGQRLIIGDGSSSVISGKVQYEYIAVDATGAYAPIPEPASLALLGLGGLMLIRRRR